jgi:molybdopterin converting factor small subunit
MEKVEIKIIFFGSFTKKTEDKEIEAVLDNDIGQVLKKIDEVIIERKGKKISYVLLLNGVNFSVKEKESKEKITLKNGDIFTVVPIVIGG